MAGDSLRADSTADYIAAKTRKRSWDKLYHRLDSGFDWSANHKLFEMGPLGVLVTATFWVPAKSIGIGSALFLGAVQPCGAIQATTAIDIAQRYNSVMVQDERSE